MWLDVRHGLPFPDSSVDGIYSCHLFEHLYWAEASFVARECRRVLRPGAGIRLLVPSLEMAIDAYREGRLNWFSDFPHPFQSPGGRLVNFLFCDGQHRLAFDHSFATELLTLAGFADIRRVAPRVGAVLPTRLLQELEPEVGYTETSLVVEAFVRR
ncbi:MAG TPA: methyltransferase domain-containing protein [Roseiflexaceae bacterium]|nr:methyltransferase domain-containing protein [Roseiflexaceae bacterium]